MSPALNCFTTESVRTASLRVSVERQRVSARRDSARGSPIARNAVRMTISQSSPRLTWMRASFWTSAASPLFFASPDSGSRLVWPRRSS